MTVIRCFALLAVCLLMPSGEAQGWKVSTVVRDASRLNKAGRLPVIANSYSLLHNGRVYDFVEAADEVVIFDSNARKFTLLNTRRKVSTSIAFAEIRQLLDAREPKIRKYIQEISQINTSAAATATRVLQFQMQPEFDSTYQSQSGNLTLKAESWKYKVSTREWESADQVKRYLTFTDWMARLNYVLHPNSSFPEPRLELNRELAELKNRLPVLVHLDQRPDERKVLQAEHTFESKLTDQDHTLINSWESALKSGELKSLTFRAYQESNLLSQNR